MYKNFFQVKSFYKSVFTGELNVNCARQYRNKNFIQAKIIGSIGPVISLKKDKSANNFFKGKNIFLEKLTS